MKTQTEYDEFLGQTKQEEILKKKLQKTQKELEKLQTQLKECA